MQPHNPIPPHSRLPAKPPRKGTPRWLPWVVLGGATLLGTLMVVALFGLIAITYLTQPRIPAGTSVAGVDISGETLESASEMLQTVEVGAQMVTLTDDARSWQISMSDLGVRVDVDATVAAAENSQGNQSMQPQYAINMTQAQQALVTISYEANIDAIPGEPPQIGRSLEIPVTLARLANDPTGELSDGVLELDMMAVEPPEYDPAVHYTGETTVHVVEPGQELALIARQYGVTMDDIVAMNDISNPDVIFVGQQLTVPAAGDFVPEDIPLAPTTNGRSLLVDTNAQRIYAYEDGVMVRTHLVSTGRTQTPTVLGDYNIYVKYTADDMRGPDYFLPAVPWTMYFYRGYAIHGTYWHNSFGRPMSHGCVNLPVAEAEWFFNFSSVGTLVRVI